LHIKLYLAFVIPGHALRVDPESSAIHWLWIPGSLALRKIDFVNFAQSQRPGMTVLCLFPREKAP
jgi:hypothetical protein